MADEIAPAVPSASVVLLRDAAAGLEVLYLRRNRRLSFHGGSWVFPGGRIDPEDYGDRSEDPHHAARAAAVRETREEAGLHLAPERLLHVAHWTTPEESPRRFATWFFMAKAPQGTVEVDGGEIHEHRWLSPSAAVEAQARGEMRLAAPSFVLSFRLAELPTASEALHAFGSRTPDTLLPRIVEIADGRLALYQGDAGYESGDPRAPGPRHRLYMTRGPWRYERS